MQCFCDSRVQAAFLAEGVDAYAVDGNTHALDRAEILRRFREGKIPVLLNCGVFTEGTDIPSVDCIIMARPTRSSVSDHPFFMIDRIC